MVQFRYDYPAGPAARALGSDRARAVVATATRLLRTAGLPLTSDRVALFYAYAEGDRPELNERLDALLTRAEPLTAARCDELYRRFVADTGARSNARLRPAGGEPRAQVSFGLMRWAGGLFGRSGFRSGRASEALPAGARAEAGSALDEEPLEDAMHRVDDLERRLQEAQEAIRELRLRLARAERNASTDSLTGIANRRGFLEVLREAVASARRHHEPLSLLMIDVDHFKAFNDRHGHYVGDHVLRLVAAALMDLPGGVRHAARYGGEEFAVVLPKAPLPDAIPQAESLRESLAERRFIMRGTGEALSPITISIGVAELAPHEFAKQLIRRADAALYQAKRAGRNCVVASQPHTRARLMPVPQALADSYIRR